MRISSRPSSIAGFLAAVLLASSTAAWAHHSFAMFDLTAMTDVKGTVKEFRFINPHSFIILKVKDKGGKAVDFAIESNGSFYLSRRGWKRDSLAAGEVVTARIHPMRDGSPGGDLIKVTKKDGSELVARLKPLDSEPAEKK